jgi:RNA polymerase sigma-70 factor (ECF subfamily)
LRERRRGEDAAAWLEWLAELGTPSDAHALPDRRLELMFACAHPAIDAAARAPLMLQAVLGFDAATIAAAFLVAPAAMSQRLVRAKAKIRQAGIGLQLPARDELGDRLGAVLSAIYAVYADAWTDAAAPTHAGANSLARPSGWPASSPPCCPRSPRPWACSRCCCIRMPAAPHAAMPTASMCR